MQALSSTMENYLKAIVESSGDRCKLMNYEWARLESFRLISFDADVSPMRLAQAGFYYSGEGDEAVCFCCDLRNRIWNNEENAREIHKRLSPNCAFVTGKDQTNVPIHSNGDNSCFPGQIKPPIGASDMSNGISLSKSATQNSTDRKAGANNAANCVLNDQLSFQNSCAEHESIHTRTAKNHSHFGAISTQPKHPDYAKMAVRSASFAGWSYTHILAPALLAEAGLFFTGVGDCVRCFVCGGGMKHWNLGDNPWVEHAKWYPQCSYVIQCKGHAFIKMCGMKGDVNMITNAKHTEENQQSDIIGQQHNSSENITNDLYEDMASDAVKVITEIGYKHEEVVMGVQLYRKKFGSVPLRAQELLEVILDGGACPETSSRFMSPSHQQIHNNDIGKHTDQTNYSDPSTKCSKTSMKKQIPSETCASLSHGARTKYQSLLEENRALRDLVTCKICMDKEACIVFLPCGHMVSCVECAKEVRKCVICRKEIAGTVRAFPA